MEEILNDIIKEHLGLSIFIMVTVIIGIISLTWWCASLYLKVKKIEQLPCVHHEDKMVELEKAIGNIKEDIAVIRSVIVQKYPTSASIFSMKKSPRRLNEMGEWLFNEIHGSDFLKKNKDFLFSKITEEHPTTALDVENAASLACGSSTGELMFSDIKNYVYNAPSIEIPDYDGGKRKYDITLGDVCFVLSLPLRDMYLQEHPEIKE